MREGGEREVDTKVNREGGLDGGNCIGRQIGKWPGR